ncbi:MAG: hypothetical protein IJP65_08640 [Bacteroidales bacterium]|nr:hypothetical protein [Bacteroidales bacterium]MBR0055353.1 hypothetical protein [Bacteroidales bacterium]
MKRIVVIISFIFAVALVASACETQHKCPAYGHYTQVSAPSDATLAQN